VAFSTDKCARRHAESPAYEQAEAARLFKQCTDAYEVLSNGAPLGSAPLLHACCSLKMQTSNRPATERSVIIVVVQQQLYQGIKPFTRLRPFTLQ